MPYGFETSHCVEQAVECLTTASLHDEPVDFVCRYYNHNSPSKNLTLTEAAALSAANIRIISVWENGYPTGIEYFNRAKGQYDGEHAFEMALEFSQPAGSAIYFAVDYDAYNVKDRAMVFDYFHGIEDAYHKYLETYGDDAVEYVIGAYGGVCCLQWLKDRELAKKFWQAHAPGWCGHENKTEWEFANLHQLENNVKICGVEVDVVRSLGDDGGWLYSP